MLKDFLKAIRKFFINRPELKPKDEPQFKRRQFFKKVALGTASIGGTTALAKNVVDSVKQPNLKDLYGKDAQTGEYELSKREYQLMSEKEKTEVVQDLISRHSRKG